MRQREQARLVVLNRVLEKKVSIADGARVLGLSERQMWRILAAYRKEGAAALVHGNRGRTPHNALGQETREQVTALAGGRYERVNQTHLTELLAEREGIGLSRSSLRRILLGAGIRSPRRRRAPKHRSRRERYPQEGMLLQVDGSRHDWLEGRGSYLTLLLAIDDATGMVPYALFREQEDAHGYLLLLRGIIQSKGIPLALYSDRHGIFRRSAGEKEDLWEQLTGQTRPTQFARALGELGTQSILARSPQAKGRVERLGGTLQDRLVVELRLAGAKTIEEANRVLWELLPRLNARFSVPAAESGSVYRQPDKDLCLDSVLCFKYWRKVAGDNTVRFFGQTLQLLPGPDRLSYAHARVEIQERLDGSLVVVYQGKAIGSREAPPQAVTLRARKLRRYDQETPWDVPELREVRAAQPAAKEDRLRTPPKPHPDHPWNKPFSHHRMAAQAQVEKHDSKQ